MRVLITGGAGFIGANFVHSTVEKYPDADITVLDKLTYAGNQQTKDGNDPVKHMIGTIGKHEHDDTLVAVNYVIEQ